MKSSTVKNHGRRSSGYALLEEEEKTVILLAQEARGLFGGSDVLPPSWRTIEFRECEVLPVKLARILRGRVVDLDIGNTDIQIIDRDGNPIGSYFLGAARITLGSAESAGEERSNIVVTGLLFTHPHPLAEGIWERWREGKPNSPGQWREYSVEGRAAWLEVVRIYHAQVGGDSSNPNTAVVLDGRNVTDRASFYCALGLDSSAV